MKPARLMLVAVAQLDGKEREESDGKFLENDDDWLLMIVSAGRRELLCLKLMLQFSSSSQIWQVLK